MSVKIPGDAIDPGGADLSTPTVELLTKLCLLPEAEDVKAADGPMAAFKGPPPSVAIIEAGATAASKWWSTAIAGGAAGSTGFVATIWDKFDDQWTQAFALLAAGLILAAAAWGIAYLLASDVRGRAAAMVAVIEARRDIAIEMTRQSGTAYGKKPLPQVKSNGKVATPLSGLPVTRRTNNRPKNGWKALALRSCEGDGVEYLLVNGGETEWVPAEKVSFI